MLLEVALRVVEEFCLWMLFWSSGKGFNGYSSVIFVMVEYNYNLGLYLSSV